KTVDAKQDERRARRINTCDLENAAYQIRIDRRFPGCGAGVSFKRIGKTIATCDSGTNAAHLEAEAEVAVLNFEFVSVAEDDVAKAQRKGDYDHPQKRCARMRPPSSQVGVEGTWLN